MLSDEDLDRIVEEAGDANSQGVLGPIDPDDVAALVVEVRRLSAALDRVEDIASEQGHSPEGDAALLGRIVGVCIDAVHRKAAYAKSEPAPLETGRWEKDGVDGWILFDGDAGPPHAFRGEGMAGYGLNAPRHGSDWSITGLDGGVGDLTANDLEAAARIIRAHEGGKS